MDNLRIAAELEAIADELEELEAKSKKKDESMSPGEIMAMSDQMVKKYGSEDIDTDYAEHLVEAAFDEYFGSDEDDDDDDSYEASDEDDDDYEYEDEDDDDEYEAALDEEDDDEEQVITAAKRGRKKGKKKAPAKKTKKKRASKFVTSTRKFLAELAGKAQEAGAEAADGGMKQLAKMCENIADFTAGSNSLLSFLNDRGFLTRKQRTALKKCAWAVSSIQRTPKSGKIKKSENRQWVKPKRRRKK